jgi:Ca-activated chloride channel homolog
VLIKELIKKWTVSAFAFAPFAATVLTFGALAQVSSPSTGHSVRSNPADKAIHVDVELVLVNVAVTDPEDRLVTTLQKENFRLFEDNVEQEIVTFSHEDAPISVGLIFDVSGSMADKVDRTRQAALQILKTANPEDEFFLVTFDAHAKLRTGFTSNVEELRDRMILIKPRGPTALLDAIHLGMKEMKNARYRRHALIVVSDGGDNSSIHTENRILRDLKEADCQLYAMGIFDQHDMKLTVEEHNGPTLLSKLAETTGGRAFSVSHLDELPTIATEVSKELRDQYVLGYKSSAARQHGKWRTIKVLVSPQVTLSPVHVYAKRGYYGPPAD